MPEPNATSPPRVATDIPRTQGTPHLCCSAWVSNTKKDKKTRRVCCARYSKAFFRVLFQIGSEELSFKDASVRNRTFGISYLGGLGYIDEIQHCRIVFPRHTGPETMLSYSRLGQSVEVGEMRDGLLSCAWGEIHE